MLASPAEPASLVRMVGAKCRASVEGYGVDFLWGSRALGGLCGVQRKEVRDLVASLHDGRLAKELAQMNRLRMRVLIVEGKTAWTRDGELADAYARITKRQLRAALWSVQARGVWVERTDSHQETAEALGWLQEWSRKDKHTGLIARPGPAGSAWGKIGNRDYQLHLLTSLPGVGVELAERILGHFGRVPLTLGVGEEELLEVKGLGKVKVKRIMEALG